MVDTESVPFRAILHCPRCGERHVDRGAWAEKPHTTHLCESCGGEFDVSHPRCFGIDPSLDEHVAHGRGDADDGPRDPDCPCRNTEKQAACASVECGFCRAAEKVVDPHGDSVRAIRGGRAG